MEHAPSRTTVAMTWAALALTAILVVLGAAWYGMSWQGT